MYYGEELVNEVRDRNDVVDVIGSYVNLKKKGTNYFGLCPFHHEKTPSFSVNRSRQMFYCFGCHKGGSVISFIREYENCSFQEAVETLAERAGMRLETREPTQEEIRERSKKERIMEINKAAAAYYYYCLREPAGKQGLDYFKNRGLSDETMKHFGLGFATQTPGLVPYLKGKGYSDEEIIMSGLAANREKYGLSELFWNRVMFPIMNVRGKVVGFGGRVMGDAKPKYVNSPETPVFEKSRNLYGLNYARSSRSDHLILCEGYMDVIAMHQAGFDQAVAALGTAFTSNHAMILARYVKKVLLIFDSDGAGISAALRAISICAQAGLQTKVVNLQPVKDPDEFIKQYGGEEFKKRLEAAENSLYFELRMMARDHDIGDPEGKTAFTHDVSARLSRIEDEVERDNYIKAIAVKYMIDEAMLKRDVARMIAKGESITLESDARSGRSANNKDNESSSDRIQRYLLSILAKEPGLYPQVKEYLSCEDFTGRIMGKVAGLLFEQLESGTPRPAAITDSFSEDEELSYVVRIFGEEVGVPPDDEGLGMFVSDLVRRIKQNRIMEADTDDGPDMLESVRRKREMMDELRRIKIEVRR